MSLVERFPHHFPHLPSIVNTYRAKKNNVREGDVKNSCLSQMNCHTNFVPKPRISFPTYSITVTLLHQAWFPYSYNNQQQIMTLVPAVYCMQYIILQAKYFRITLLVIMPLLRILNRPISQLNSIRGKSCDSCSAKNLSYHNDIIIMLHIHLQNNLMPC